MDTPIIQRARRLAKRLGLVLKKDRAIYRSFDRQGGWMIVSDKNEIIGGLRFEIATEDIIEILNQIGEAK